MASTPVTARASARVKTVDELADRATLESSEQHFFASWNHLNEWLRQIGKTPSTSSVESRIAPFPCFAPVENRGSEWSRNGPAT